MDTTNFIKQVSENPLLRFLGVKVDVATAERVVLTMKVTPDVHQYVGIMHGGISVYLAETAASIGAVIGADLTKVTPVGIEINGNHLRSVSRGIISVEAKPVYGGRTLSVWNISVTNDQNKLICTSRCTILLQNRPAIAS